MNELHGMIQIDFTDQEFAKFLNYQDSNWTWDSIKEFNRFIAKGKMIALVKYKNEAPLARWIWIDKDLIVGYMHDSIIYNTGINKKEGDE